MTPAWESRRHEHARYDRGLVRLSIPLPNQRRIKTFYTGSNEAPQVVPTYPSQWLYDCESVVEKEKRIFTRRSDSRSQIRCQEIWIWPELSTPSSSALLSNWSVELVNVVEVE
jgi:hypothetical protein